MSELEGGPEDGAEHQGGRAAPPGGPGGRASVESAGGSPGVGMGAEGGDSAGGPSTWPESPQGQEGDVPQPLEHDAVVPPRSPLFYAQNALRYERQQLIRNYQDAYDCRLIVVVDQIFHYSVQLFEELLFNASPEQDLHLLLWSPGGDGEVAVRLVRSAQARCRALTVIVPDIAKSAATLLILGADRILMGPTSDLGPVDPQFQVSEFEVVSA